MIHELTSRTVERIPDLSHRPEFDGPWQGQRVNGRITHWWRIDTVGTIYRVEVPSGEARRF